MKLDAVTTGAVVLFVLNFSVSAFFSPGIFPDENADVVDPGSNSLLEPPVPEHFAIEVRRVLQGNDGSDDEDEDEANESPTDPDEDEEEAVGILTTNNSIERIDFDVPLKFTKFSDEECKDDSQNFSCLDIVFTTALHLGKSED